MRWPLITFFQCMVVRVQMGGVTGRSVKSSDSPMFASS